jgi:uncharacterized protein (DUF433 family)
LNWRPADYEIRALGRHGYSWPELLQWGYGHSEYVEKRNGGFYVADTRVSLDSIVYSFKAGGSPETIRQGFSFLSLEQVYGAMAFYLAHAQEVEANIREGEAQIDRSVPSLSESRPELYARLERARHEIGTQDFAKHRAFVFRRITI